MKSFIVLKLYIYVLICPEWKLLRKLKKSLMQKLILFIFSFSRKITTQLLRFFACPVVFFLSSTLFSFFQCFIYPQAYKESSGGITWWCRPNLEHLSLHLLPSVSGCKPLWTNWYMEISFIPTFFWLNWLFFFGLGRHFTNWLISEERMAKRVATREIDVLIYKIMIIISKPDSFSKQLLCSMLHISLFVQ